MISYPELIYVCPVCKNVHTHLVLKIKDHSVSGEFFDVYECDHCHLRFTQNAPVENLMGPYYQSDNYISHSNTRKGLVNQLYHLVRQRTLASKYHLIKKTTGLSQGAHLDIGAGTGAFVQYMNEHGWKSQGIEPDEKAREKAMEHHQTRLLPGPALETIEAESFNAISLWHVLEHVHDLYPYLDRIRKILKPSGLAFIAVPNYTSYDAMKYKENWAAYDVPIHLYHFSPPSMKYLLKEAGFKLVQTIPMWYDSFYISLLSEKYAGNHSVLLKGFLSGAISNLKAISDKEKCSSLIYVAG